jgi:hypothetical protein
VILPPADILNGQKVQDIDDVRTDAEPFSSLSRWLNRSGMAM